MNAQHEALREAFLFVLGKVANCDGCDGSGQDNDGDNWIDAPCPYCAETRQVLGVIEKAIPDEERSQLANALFAIESLEAGPYGQDYNPGEFHEEPTGFPKKR